MEWISVEDRLPQYGKEVIAVKGDSVFHAIRRFTNSKGEFWSHTYRLTNKDELSAWEAAKGITHWMPLPEPPIDN